MANPILKIRNLTKIYDKRIVLDNINLDVYVGEILGIIGPSGSGKTTLLNTLIGFIKPEAGDVLFKLNPLVGDNNDDSAFKSIFSNQTLVKKMFGFAPQHHSFYEKLTVKENLEYFAYLYGLDKEYVETNLNSLLDFMGLSNFKDLLAENLSGGMARRLDIACSLIHNPSFLILDEPTSDLDPILRAHILSLIKKINKKGTTVVISSHDLHEIEMLCDRVAIIYNGRIIEVGTPLQLKKKFSKKTIIKLESHPGNYNKFLKKFKTNYEKAYIDGSELVIETTMAFETLKKIINVLDKENETIVDLKVNQPDLNDLFFEIINAEMQKVGVKK